MPVEIINNDFKTIEVMGFNVFSDDLDKINYNSTCKSINTISPNSYGISTYDPIFRQALIDTDFLVLDGVYFALGSIFLHGKNIKKNQGPDVFLHFMQRLNKSSGKVFFLGSSDRTLDLIKQKANIDYPNISLDYFSPPYKDFFDNEDIDIMISKINLFNPDILFVGMTAPKQEKWVHQNKSKLETSLVITIGAVFDWYAGNEKSISPIWWKLRLGWLIRSIQRPEIFKRYPNIFIFFKHLFMTFFGLKNYTYAKR